MSKLDEVALRRPNFDSSGFAVELADGQKWRLPAIKIRAFPVEKDDGEIGVEWKQVYAVDVDKELDIILGVVDANAADMIDAKMRIAARLLKCNYDLPKGAVGELLSLDFGEECSQSRWDRITAAILGRDPEKIDVSEEEEIDGDPKTVSAPGSN